MAKKKNKNKQERLFTITLNEKQLRTLEQMTDHMSRVICGQLDYGMKDYCEEAWCRDHATEEHPHGIGAEGWREMREELTEHLQAIRRLCWNCGYGESYGIGYHPLADELYDIHQVIRKFRYDTIFTDDERHTMRYTVMANNPLHTGAEPLIKVAEKEDEPC